MKNNLNKINEILKENFNNENEIFEIDNIYYLILNDSLSYEIINSIIDKINKIEDLINKSEIYIIYNGHEFYRNEKYFIKLFRFLEEKKYKYYIIFIPFCYLQDFSEKSLELLEYAQNGFIKNDAFKEYFYYEDCKFCKVKSICPGAKKIFEDQVFAVFKDQLEIISKLPDKLINLKLFKSQNIKNISNKINEELLKEDITEKYVYFINESSFLNSFIKEINMDLFNRVYLLTRSNEFEENDKFKKVNFEKVVYKSLITNKNNIKIIRMPLELEISDNVILLIDNNLSSILKEFSLDLIEEEEIFNILLSIHNKVKYYIYKKENEFYLCNSLLTLIDNFDELKKYFSKYTRITNKINKIHEIVI